MIFDDFTDDDRRTLLVAFVYEKERKKRNQWGYKVFREISLDIVQDSVFLRFSVVRKWIEETGWEVAWDSRSWQAYIRFVFEFLSPTIPQPSQLKNKILLQKFMNEYSEQPKEPERTTEQLEDLYRRLLNAKAE